ncbi:UNVERIFIED_ORG: hypothetical protein J2X79_003764 [Arthrobacter globiformis]|nr:hypothetical protein [Arthrobacter globiformis]
MSRYSNYRMRLKAESDAAKAASLAHVVELRRMDEQRHLTDTLTESGRNAQMQSTLGAFLLAQSSAPSLVKGPHSHE